MKKRIFAALGALLLLLMLTACAGQTAVNAAQSLRPAEMTEEENAVLALLGGKMLWEAFTEDENEGDGKDAEKIDLGEYLILAIATSIDALAVGISFAALSVDIVPAVSLIGITTFLFSVAGVAIGHTFGARYEKPATIVGGVVLVLIGLKILLEHLGILAL